MILKPDLTPEKTLSEIRSVLARACLDRNHKMRYFTFCTSAPGTAESACRMVVFRRLIDTWTIRFYTDSRSSKVAELKQNPNCSLLFWNPGNNLQIRMKAEARLHHLNKITSEEWMHIQGSAVKSYSSEVPPGTAIDSPEKAHSRNPEAGPEFFAVVDCTPFEIRALQLNSSDHLALRFIREDAAKTWTGGWIVP